MRPFDLGDIKMQGMYLFADLTRLTGISRQTLRRASDEGRLVVYPHRPSMTKGEWFLDYVKNKRSLKVNFEGNYGKRKKLPRMDRALGDPSLLATDLRNNPEVRNDSQISDGAVRP